MTFYRDLAHIRNVCLELDPSFADTDPVAIREALESVENRAGMPDKEAFLLAAMRLFALPQNGHTRIIPNNAVSVLPIRIVAVGSGFVAHCADDGQTGEIATINGVPVEVFFERATPYLAGTRQRQRVIAGLVMSWPSALHALNAGGIDGETVYTLHDGIGETFVLRLREQHAVHASTLYPVSEHGRLDAPRLGSTATDRIALGSENITYLAFDAFTPALVADLDQQIALAQTAITDAPHHNLIIDLRGNPGGSFFKTVPVIDTLKQHWHGRRCVVLVNKFTFSAAIVFVALLKDALGNQLHIVGEEMGDHAQFFAEGDTLELGESCAMLRYSTAYHDWKTGTAHPTTPSVIAESLVGVGDLFPDLLVDIGLSDLSRTQDPQLQSAIDMVHA